MVLQVRLRNVQERTYWTSVFGLSINECCITKIAPTALQVDVTKKRNMNYVL